ncbi:MAG: SRPBCC domain-containing protein [Pseudomonadota bacterium]
MQIEKCYQLPYPPERVYAAWVSSDTVIPPATAMDIDPRVGGHYRLIIEGPEFSARNEGRFSAVTPGKHLAYSWEWNGDGECSMIDVTFHAANDGSSTRIELRHSGFTQAESQAMHDSGWDAYIEGLITFLAN